MSEKDPPSSPPKPAPLADDSVDELFSAVSSAKQRERAKEASPARPSDAPLTPNAATPGAAGPRKIAWIVGSILVLAAVAWGVSKLGERPSPSTASSTGRETPVAIPVNEPPRTPVERQISAPPSTDYRSTTPPAFIDSRRNDPRPVPPPPPPPPTDDRDQDRIDPTQESEIIPHEENYPGQEGQQQPAMDEGIEAQPPQEN